jgi:ATP-dependent helicase/nuclease subunit B
MTVAAPKVFTIPSGIPFAQALAKGVIGRVGGDPLALADVMIFVPTRRAARNLGEAFVREQKGAALGPRIRALGDVEEDEFSFDTSGGDLELPPAIAPLRRRLLLATLVQRWESGKGEEAGLAQAIAHAGELARFLDEAHTQGVDFAKLEGLVTGALATHWQDVVKFLGIVTSEWPEVLKDEGTMEPALRRDEMLRRAAKRLVSKPPRLVIAAGSTGSIPATAELLKTIATLPGGAVVLPGLDTTLDDESWNDLESEPGHPQYGLRQLLGRLGVERKDVAQWDGQKIDGTRSRFLSEALRPPPTTDAWRALADNEKQSFVHALDGLSLVEAATPREEALVIACALREVLETPGRNAALVTPDRGLGRRVAAELARWDIAIDDSAGQPLTRTQAGAFLALLARAAAEEFAPVPLLALLKHPLCAGGMARVDFLRSAREMEKKVLHGLRPAPGLQGIADALNKKGAPKEASPELKRWFTDLSTSLDPFVKAIDKSPGRLDDIAKAHGLAAEALAATARGNGPANLWSGDAGEAAARLMSELWDEGREIALGDGASYGELFRALADAHAVRPAYGRHPRLAILGPLEARLLHFDLVILGGLNEGTWPSEASTDPWLSRPLRAQLGLEPPERRIGQAAHDFATLAASPNVLLTRSLKQDGAPTVASRWLLRLKQLAKGLDLETKLAPDKPLLAWARGIDDRPRSPRAKRPAPTPPVAARPRALSVTKIETWRRDPYAIYGRYVLRLKVLDAIDMEPGPLQRGTAVHAALEEFLNEFPDALPPNAMARLLAIGDEAFAKAGASPSVMSLWGPRFARAARAFFDFENTRRKQRVRSVVEQEGVMVFPSEAGDFTLKGRADRIDLFADGDATVIDYKTGSLPSHRQVELLLSPQLPLEAAMLLAGKFPGITAKTIRQLLYIKLGGGEPPAELRPVDVKPNEIAHEAEALVKKLIAYYDKETTPYLSRVLPYRASDIGDYDHLARVREWTAYGDDE